MKRVLLAVALGLFLLPSTASAFHRGVGNARAFNVGFRAGVNRGVAFDRGFAVGRGFGYSGFRSFGVGYGGFGYAAPVNLGFYGASYYAPPVAPVQLQYVAPPVQAAPQAYTAPVQAAPVVKSRTTIIETFE